MRVQLLADHTFTHVGGTTVMLHAGSIIGTNAGDYPLSQIANFAVTVAMASLDAAATTAIGTEQTRMNGVVIPPGQGKASGVPVPQPHKGASVTANATKSWSN
jgi:hypothetical protein